MKWDGVGWGGAGWVGVVRDGCVVSVLRCGADRRSYALWAFEGTNVSLSIYDFLGTTLQHVHRMQLRLRNSLIPMCGSF